VDTHFPLSGVCVPLSRSLCEPFLCLHSSPTSSRAIVQYFRLHSRIYHAASSHPCLTLTWQGYCEVGLWLSFIQHPGCVLLTDGFSSIWVDVDILIDISVHVFVYCQSVDFDLVVEFNSFDISKLHLSHWEHPAVCERRQRTN